MTAHLARRPRTASTATRRVAAAVAAALTLAGAGIAAATSASAASAGLVEPPVPAFYQPPASLPASNGDLIRSESSAFALGPLQLAQVGELATVKRIMYRSTDRTGQPIAVTGTVLVPKLPWLGLGARPLVSYAPGTQGLGDQCAPSRKLALGMEYEGPFVLQLLQQGWAVVMTDYQGLGTPGVHTYMDRVAQGHAVLDAARAAQRAGLGLSATGKVGLAGYSQGGAASASAAELASAYAPELKIVGAVAGAVPADLALVGANVDGGLYTSFGLMATIGLATSYGINSLDVTNDRGDAVEQDLSTSCAIESVAKYPYVPTSELTTTGQTLPQLLGSPLYAGMVRDQLIAVAASKPAFPVLINHSHLDDVIPFQAGQELAKRWCAKGVNVQFRTSVVPTHLGAALRFTPDEVQYLGARFTGLPAINNCWAVPIL